jgi:hypothetical protein
LESGVVFDEIGVESMYLIFGGRAILVGAEIE